MSAQAWWIVGAVNGFVSVCAGAFGAHGLKPRLSPEMLTIFETGARYQMYHALALRGRYWFIRCHRRPRGRLVLRRTLFSGLYALSLSGVTKQADHAHRRAASCRLDVLAVAGMRLMNMVAPRSW
jgi:uncharacterized membrane protein YgdD (TMEM256/DUF423 family)